MKKILKIYIFILLMFVFTTNVFALCNDNALNSLAEIFEAKLYELRTEVYQNEDGTYATNEPEYAYVIAFYPYYDGINIKVSVDGVEQEVKYDSEYETYVIKSDIHYDNKEYIVSVYGNENTSCNKELIKKVSYEINGYNDLKLSSFCRNNPNDELCSVDYDSSSLSDEELNKLIDSKIEENKIKEMSMFERIINILLTNWYFILLPIIIISLFYTIKIISYKKKEKNK